MRITIGGKLIHNAHPTFQLANSFLSLWPIPASIQCICHLQLQSYPASFLALQSHPIFDPLPLPLNQCIINVATTPASAFTHPPPTNPFSTHFPSLPWSQKDSRAVCAPGICQLLTHFYGYGPLFVMEKGRPPPSTFLPKSHSAINPFPGASTHFLLYFFPPLIPRFLSLLLFNPL